MDKKKRHNPWIWVPGIFATEGVVSATVTYVSLLMFIQLGASYAFATLLSASLLLLSIVKQFNFLGNKFNKFLKIFTISLQFLLFIAFIFTAHMVNSFKTGIVIPFACLMAVALINAFNEKCVFRYYNNILNRQKQKVLGNYKFVASQISFIVTYGILIIFVGLHEIFFRNLRLAWTTAFYLIAGVIMALIIVNAFLLKKPNKVNEVDYLKPRPKSLPKKILIRNGRFLFIIFMLLLPQALMFASRVLFLMASEDEGGLGCTLQDVGFAQGTIGVIAFSIATLIGQHLMRKFGQKRLFWIMILPLIISPVFYLIMNFLMRTDLLSICIMTFAAQFCFGFGLNICVVFINRTNQVFEDNIINLIHNPIVVAAMFIPIACSGWLINILGFKWFFMINASAAILSILTLIINYKFIVRHILNYKTI